MQKDNLREKRAPARLLAKIASGSLGLSLIEVIVALGLAALLVPALMQGLVILINHGDLAYDRSILMELAQGQLESTQSQTYKYNVAGYTTVSQPEGYTITLSGSTPVAYYYPSPLSTPAAETMQRINVNVAGVRGSMDLEFYKVNLANVTPPSPLSVTTLAASSITPNSATLNGNLGSLGTAASVNVSFEWGTTAGYGNTTASQTLTAPGAFSANLTGLTPGTVYHFRAKAVGDDTVVGSDAAFTTRVAVTVYSVADSYVNRNLGDTNYGAATSMLVRSTTTGQPDANMRSFVQFDLSSIPAAATIQSATLELWMTAAPGASRTHDLHRVTLSWTQTGITWNNQPGVNATATGSTSSGTTPNVWVSWTVTADVQGFVNGTYTNYGWRIKDSVESASGDFSATYATSETAGSTSDPKLTVTYTP